MSCRLANKKEKSQLNEPNEKRPLFNLYNEGSDDVSSSRDRTTTRCCYQRLGIYIYTMRTHTHPHTHIGSSSSSCNPKGILVERERERERWKCRQKGKEQKIRPIVCVCVEGGWTKKRRGKSNSPVSCLSATLDDERVFQLRVQPLVLSRKRERERERGAK